MIQVVSEPHDWGDKEEAREENEYQRKELSKRMPRTPLELVRRKCAESKKYGIRRHSTMMTSEMPPSLKQPSLPTADTMVSREIITKLDPNDVIFGRGSATSSYIGNKVSELARCHARAFSGCLMTRAKLLPSLTLPPCYGSVFARLPKRERKSISELLRTSRRKGLRKRCTITFIR